MLLHSRVCRSLNLLGAQEKVAGSCTGFRWRQHWCHFVLMYNRWKYVDDIFVLRSVSTEILPHYTCPPIPPLPRCPPPQIPQEIHMRIKYFLRILNTSSLSFQSSNIQLSERVFLWDSAAKWWPTNYCLRISGSEALWSSLLSGFLPFLRES